MNNTANKEIIDISIEDIIPNRFQPRLTFDVEALNELASSIKEHGIIQPLVVRRLQDKYEIIAGERRFKAATLVGMRTVPCIVMNLNDNESAEVAVIENIQRKEMTSLEEAKSFKKILDKGYLTQEELAKKMGKSQSSIANKLRLLNLDDLVQDAILNGRISERHARSILRLENKEDQRKVLAEILEKRLTVRQTDDLIKDKYENKNVMNNNYLSFPEVNIPTSNIINGVNPQANLINNIGRVDNISNVVESAKENPIIENQSSSLDIFKYDSQNENVQKQKEPDIQNVINPSVFSNMNSNVDINAIKSNAEDINQEKPLADIQTLMSGNEKTDNNKFFVDLDMKDEVIDLMDNNSNIQNFNNAVEVINKEISNLREKGTKIYKEEIDLGNSYQIIIRIDK